MSKEIKKYALSKKTPKEKAKISNGVIIGKAPILKPLPPPPVKPMSKE